MCGFMRSMPLEAPQLKSQVVDLPGSLEAAAQRIYDEICQEVLQSKGSIEAGSLAEELEPEVAYRSEGRCVPRLARFTLKPGASRIHLLRCQNGPFWGLTSHFSAVPSFSHHVGSRVELR